jgi:hypothetical protein
MPPEATTSHATAPPPEPCERPLPRGRRAPTGTAERSAAADPSMAPTAT